MIEKISFDNEPVLERCGMLARAINEIIDHLPQEKDYNVCQYLGCKISTNGEKFCSLHEIDAQYCKCKTPLPDTTNHCHTCGYEIKQPTKEVPDIRGILEDLVKEVNEDLDKRDGMSISNVSSINRAIQEISALYTRGNK